MGAAANMLQVTNEEREEILIDPSILEEGADSHEPKENPNHLSLDKYWEAICFMLTGKTLTEAINIKPPLLWLYFSDKVIDEELNFGNGPANYIDSDQVKQLNDEFKKIASEEFKSRYDPGKMELLNIYPNKWGNEGEEKELAENFSKVKAFYEKRHRKTSV